MSARSAEDGADDVEDQDQNRQSDDGMVMVMTWLTMFQRATA